MDSGLTIIFGFLIMVIIISAIKQYSLRKIQYKERMAFLEKGQPLPLNEDLKSTYDTDKEKIGAAKYALSNGIIWIGVSVGVAAAFGLISIIFGDKDILVVCALALIPFFIGISCFIKAFFLKKWA
jgi:hypothetical protein